MTFIPTFPVMALLSATALAGCASQNAMTMLPQDVQLAMAADAARDAAPAEPSSPADTGMAAGEPATASSSAQALSPVEIEFRRQQARVASGRPEGLARASAQDAVELFNQARQLQAVRAIGRQAPEPGGQTQTAAEQSPEATWNAALAKARTEAGKEPAGTDTTIITAAVDGDSKPAETVEFVILAGTMEIPADIAMQLRLKALGGRKVRRIVVGRLEGSGFEVLARAQEIARTVATVTGGEPGMSYDPAMSAGAVRVEYEPFSRVTG